MRELIQQLLAANPEIDPRELISSLGAFSGARLREQLQKRKPLPRHTPPTTPTRYIMRVDLVGTKPPIWRRVSVPSDITLDRLHAVIQAAFDWTDSHLHRFAPTGDRYGQEFEAIVTPSDVEEGEDGVLEETIRLDELMHAPGDKLRYTYDFGDDWEHTLKFEKAEPRDSDDDGCGCLAGSRAAPPEDSGGVHYYEHMLEVAEDPSHLEHGDMLERMTYYAVGDPTEFDLAATDRAVRRTASAATARAWIAETAATLPLAVTELFDELGESARLWLAGFVADARLDEPVEVTEAIARDATAVIRAFLEYVGDGITLTSAGYLPPAAVVELMERLDTHRQWIGQATREVQAYPLHILRETVTRLGLTRKHRGRLLPTKAGTAGLDSPLALWRQVATRLPLGTPSEGRDAATFLLLSLAAGEPATRDRLSGSLDLFTAMLGWRLGGPGRYGNASAIRYTRDTQWVLEWAVTGALLPPREDGDETMGHPRARLLARAALAPRV